jgi:hypothetical protein
MIQSDRRLLKKLPEIILDNAQGQNRPLRLMFKDEARFGRISDPHSCWAPRDCRPEVQVQIVREYTYVFVAVSPHDGTLDSLILPEVNAHIMSIFLAEVAVRHPKEWILMFMDQAAWHKANDLQLPEKICLQWLPAYSPQCNPVDHIWDDIREKWFANRVFESLDSVEDTLFEATVNLEKDKQKISSLTGFDWIVSISLNAT